jgi:hypothetical protein
VITGQVPGRKKIAAGLPRFRPGRPIVRKLAWRIWTALLPAALGAVLPVLAMPRADAAQAILCGRPVSFDMPEAPGDHGFVGVWQGGQWNANICGALVVERAAGDLAEIIYVYGPSGPRSRMPWNALHRTAHIAGNELTFRDDQGGTFVFRLVGSEMAARFIDFRGRSLQTLLQREPMAEPPPQAARLIAPPLEKEEAPKPPPPVDPAESLIATAREEKKPELIKSYLLKNADASDATALRQAYVDLSNHAKSHPFGVVQTLKIYDSPNIEGKVLREDPIGKIYVIVRKEGDFTYVEYDLDKYGYIYHGFLE